MPATKTKKVIRSKFTKMGYFGLRDEADKAIADRRELPIGRNGRKTIQRRFHITAEDIKVFKQMHTDGDKFPNPHNSGNYHYIVEALKVLGLNSWHTWKEFYAKVRELMGREKNEKGETLWQLFRDKAPKSKDNALDVDGRLRQNVEVLQRISATSKNPYGLRIHQIGHDVLGKPGACIDISGTDGRPERIRLNTNPEMSRQEDGDGGFVKLPVPQNDLKRRRGVATPVKASKPRVVKAEKPAKVSAPKARKPRKVKEVQPAVVAETAAPVAAEPELAGV